MNTNFLDSVTNFLKKRTFELLGLILILTGIALAISFATYAPEDPSFIYGDSNIEIKNFFGIYGSSIADFLLQSFGLASFLLLANFLFWGISLLIKKEIKRIILKLFLVILYLTLGSIFIYLTFNNSFWLIDNGNSGFVGEISYNFISNLAPWINNEYSLFVLFFLTLTFFIFSSDLNLKKIMIQIFKSLFKKKDEDITPANLKNDNIQEEIVLAEKPQQSFIFESEGKEEKLTPQTKVTYKLPSIEFLEKISSKPSLIEANKNRPDAQFMEKILLDFGIDGKIKAINSGPVVSLYEFEPAPGVKVSKIINLSEDLARNTSSTS
ncbi:DNA translocase FtsK 4TM domain-containing protein, partial [Pelagibacterales bacterium SAG-MED05]|nr:DNA translocase FtsK 4TM domain-containing protein [Pelagibacterales bacterium SAG-MED05]